GEKMIDRQRRPVLCDRAARQIEIGWPMRLAAALIALAPFALPAPGASAQAVTHRLRDVTISPDGKYVAWTGSSATAAPGSAAPNELLIMDRARGIGAVEIGRASCRERV